MSLGFVLENKLDFSFEKLYDQFVSKNTSVSELPGCQLVSSGDREHELTVFSHK